MSWYPATPFAVAAVTALVIVELAHAELPAPQRRCATALNRASRVLSRAVHREAERCIDDHAHGAPFSSGDPTPVSDIAACTRADRSGRIARARAALARYDGRMCTGVDEGGVPKRPPELVSAPATIEDAADDGGDRFVATLFGADEAAAIQRTDDPAGAVCQAALATGLSLCERAVLAELVQCTDLALRPGTSPAPTGATDPAELDACFAAPPTPRRAAACDDDETPDRLRRALAGCAARGVLPDVSLPHCGAADLEEAHECLRAPAACSACLQIARVARLQPNCDLFDDGLDNLTCGCGDGVLSPAEECDDGNRTAGDGCSASCVIEAQTVFVTSTLHAGDLGGLVDADTICQARADATGLPGTYKAWLSLVGVDAALRMTMHAAPYARTDGVVVAVDANDLLDGALAAPIVVDEAGQSLAGVENELVWTHTASNGLAAPGDPCNAWTSDAPTRFAAVGRASESDEDWTDLEFRNCDKEARLYCVQQ